MLSVSLLVGEQRNLIHFLGTLGHSPNRRIIDITFNRRPSSRVFISRQKRATQKGKSKKSLFIQKPFTLSTEKYILLIFLLGLNSQFRTKWTAELSKEIVQNPRLKRMLAPTYFQKLKELFRYIYQNQHPNWLELLKTKDPYAYSVLK